MINTLSNKLFQFETIKNGQCNENFLFYLAEDIVKLLKKVKEKGLEYSLTPHEKEVAQDVNDYYNQYNKGFLQIAS